MVRCGVYCGQDRMNAHAVPDPGTRQFGVTSTVTVDEVPEYVIV